MEMDSGKSSETKKKGFCPESFLVFFSTLIKKKLHQGIKVLLLKLPSIRFCFFFPCQSIVPSSVSLSVSVPQHFC